MKLVKLIIEVTDELLEHIDDPCNDEDLLRYIIKHGTPLPEHHGDLKDIGNMELLNVQVHDDYSKGWHNAIEYCVRQLRERPTIIPATGNEFFNFDAPIIKKQTTTKEEKQNCEECAKWTDDCEESFFFGNKYCDGKLATKEGDGEC